MFTSVESLQILYEISMSIGTSLDLHKMLKVSLSTLLRKLNCSAGWIHILKKDHQGKFKFERIYSIPRNIERNGTYQAVLQNIPSLLDEQQLVNFKKRLPLVGRIESENYFHIMELSDFGLIVLLKNGEELAPLIIKSLYPLLLKLSGSCNACLQNTELEKAHNELERRVKERTAELVKSNEQLKQEIAERKQTEKALQESEEQYHGIFNSAIDAFLIFNPEGKIIEANPAACKMYGYPCEELVGKSGKEIVHSDYYYIFEDFKEKVNSARRFHAESVDVRKDGSSFNVEVSGTPFNYRGRPHLLAVVRDITERKRLEAQLLQAQKMEAIGILAGGVAHDFNNLLTAIRGNAELAMMEMDDKETMYKDLKQIILAANRAASLTRQLLLFSRKQPMQFTSLNLNKSVENLLKMLKRLIGEDLIIQTELEPDPWNVQADPGNIEQVILNLAINARDAMPEGGKLTIKTENTILNDEYCKFISEARPGKFVRISVEDTGIGIDKQTIQHIFEPFFTTKDTGKGTGLGLSVVYGIVKQHEGWINVYSEPGQGSTFKFYLPAICENSKDETKKKIPLNKLKGKGERILLVEDENGVRKFAARALRESGYVVFEAENVQEALKIFNHEKGNFQLIFSDVVLPDVSGLVLVDQLLSQNPKLNILMSSGYADEKSQWPIIQKRGFRFIHKPYAMVGLLEAIKDCVNQHK